MRVNVETIYKAQDEQRVSTFGVTEDRKTVGQSNGDLRINPRSNS